MRYSKLQQASDSDLDTLRQQQQHLQSQLDLTTRKLENLTDIERQLSTRKHGGNYNLMRCTGTINSLRLITKKAQRRLPMRLRHDKP